MPYISTNYTDNRNAPSNKFVCDPESRLGRAIFTISRLPTEAEQKGPTYCGGCVAFVKQVCRMLPPTKYWKQGALVKGNRSISAGTVIANFNDGGGFDGHAAIYNLQDTNGIHVYDQFVGEHVHPIGPRLIRWGTGGYVANDGDKFYVVESDETSGGKKTLR